MARFFSSVFNALTGPVAEGTTEALVKQVVEGAFSNEAIKEAIKTHGKMLRGGIFADLSLDDESAFERVKELLEKEMRDEGMEAMEAAREMYQFDHWMEGLRPQWRAKVFRYTVIAQKEMEGRLSVLRRMFTLPGGNTSAERDLILRNIASEEPIMMKLGEFLMNKIFRNIDKAVEATPRVATAFGKWFVSDQACELYGLVWIEIKELDTKSAAAAIRVDAWRITNSASRKKGGYFF